MVLTQLQVLSTHADGAQCELIKVDPRINLDSLPIQFSHGTIMSHKKVALIQNFLSFFLFVSEQSKAGNILANLEFLKYALRLFLSG